MGKLGLYGYGTYGKRASESLRRYWGGRHLVTAIFDEDPDGKKDDCWDLPVLSPDRIEEEYGKGTFDTVMICIYALEGRKEAMERLEALGIPLFIPGKAEDFAGPESFLQAEEPEIRVDEDNYSFHVYRNMLGAAADFERCQFFFLFNEEGKVNIDNFRNYPEFQYYFLMHPFRLKDPLPEKIYMEGSYCLLAKAYSINYWHFTFESLDCVYLMEKAGFQGKYIYNARSFTKDLLLSIGISPDRLIATEDLELHKVYVFETLYDINHEQILPVDHSDKVIPQMARLLQSNLKRDSRLPKKLYIKRIGVRKLLNGEDIAVKNGYTVIVPEEYSVREQMDLFHNADIILCPHGANSTNFIYMREGAVFAEIFSDRWHMRLNGQHCKHLGIHYLEMEGPAHDDGSLPQFLDYTVKEESLQRFIDRAEAIAAAEAGKN